MWRDRTIYGLAPDRIESIAMKVNGPEGLLWRLRNVQGTLKTPAKDASSWSLVGEALEPLPNNNLKY